MMVVKSGIYKIVNLLSNHTYIGSATSLYNREHRHFSCLKLNKHNNRHLQKSYNKHGKDNFKFELLEIVEDKEKLIEREQFYINEYIIEDKKGNKIVDSSRCYNILPVAGSRLGIKSNNDNRVINLDTDEIFDSMTEASKILDIPLSNICRACQGSSKTAGGFRWDYMNGKVKKNPTRTIRKTKTSNRNQNCKKKVLNETTQIKFHSLVEAAKYYNILPCTIGRVCRGHAKTAGGFVWSFVN